MRRVWIGAGAGLVGVIGAGFAVVLATAPPSASGVSEAPANTAAVERGRLSSTLSLNGTLGYRGRSDGSPYSVINQARGIYTALPEVGDRAGCGDVLARVDDRPVLVLCGSVPAYRTLRLGDTGRDVAQLNANLRRVGATARAHAAIGTSERRFTWATQRALETLQRTKGMEVDGTLELGEALFVRERVRIAKVDPQLGSPARPGTPLAQASGDTLHVQVDLAPSQQDDVEPGDRARISLPGNRSVTGTVVRLGRVATVPSGPDETVADATIPAFVSLDDPASARGLDRAPVQVQITTTRVADALSVPVTAVVGQAGGGYAVEVVRSGGDRAQIGVTVGLFDEAAGRVQVTGALRAGDRVVVPSL